MSTAPIRRGIKKLAKPPINQFVNFDSRQRADYLFNLAAAIGPEYGPAKAAGVGPQANILQAIGTPPRRRV
jgi:hypothetical protein